jgi:hypothetical protein
VNVLVDTLIVLWVLENGPKLSDAAEMVLTQANHRFHVSSRCYLLTADATLTGYGVTVMLV